MPPLLAILIVAGVQAWNMTRPAPDSANIDQPVTTGLNDLSNAPAPTTADIVPLGGVDTSDTDRRIAFWQGRVQTQPHSETAWIYLGDLFDLKGRQTGDVSQYLAAQQAYQQAITVAPNSTDAHAGAARILSTLHDFGGALTEATTVLELDPNANGALAVAFDAAVELGEMDNAQRAFDLLQKRLADVPAVTVRQARLTFLHGDATGAANLARSAATDSAASGNSPTSVAFYDFTAAEYNLMAGNLDAAESGYEAALAALPGYPPAIYGEGRVAFARGDLATATARLETATAALPRPDMLSFLGDLYALSGDTTKAENEYATVDFIAAMVAQAGGKVYDREYAIFLADHNRTLDHALALTQTEIQQRQDIYGYDALAWTLHATGRDAEALTAARQALALGTTDPKLLLHAGMIEIANGLTADGKAHLQQAFALHVSVEPLVVDAAKKALAAP